MKKALLIVLVLTFLLVLVGCDPVQMGLDRDKLIANTVKIELVDYENENPKLVSIKGWNKPHFDFDKATLIATLDESRFEDLLNDLADRGYTYYSTAHNEPLGKTLVLYQSSGNIIVLWGCTYTIKNNDQRYGGSCYVFDENGSLVEYIGRVGHLFSDYIESAYFSDNP